MSEWKALRKASGTGWKELERESGTGWKALEWEYEDFTTFTEVDVGADRIQKTANHIDHLAYRNESTYLYKDYGVDHFGNFTHKIKVKRETVNLDGWGCVWGLSNVINDNYNTATQIIVNFYGSSMIYLYERNSNDWYGQSWSSASGSTWYYIKIVKSGTALSAYIYSDSDYSNLLTTLSLTLHVDHQFRYLYGCNTYNSGDSHYINTDIENFNLG